MKLAELKKMYNAGEISKEDYDCFSVAIASNGLNGISHHSNHQKVFDASIRQVYNTTKPDKTNLEKSK